MITISAPSRVSDEIVIEMFIYVVIFYALKINPFLLFINKYQIILSFYYQPVILINNN